MTGSALYRKVAEDIKAAIAAGTYPANTKLPSESELAKRYSVSRGTVRQAFAALRADGVIASRRGARRVVIGGPRVLGWGALVDLVLSPADAGRGRPWPDMPLTALLRLGGGSVHELAVVGDTTSDVESGLRAGAGIVAGVLTGESTRDELAAVPSRTGLPGSPLILDSIADLLPRLS